MNAALFFTLFACWRPPDCPGLPDDLPSDWGTIPEGLDTDAFDEEVRSLMRAGCIPGLSASVVDADGLILSAAWGWANLDERIPVTVETPFMVASTSKAIDAIALLLAEEDGLLDREMSVSDAVGFPVRNERLRGGETLRMKHLVTHSSGIQDNWDQVLDASYAPGDPQEPLGEFLESYLTPDGEHFHRRGNFFPWPAGREWMYSNVGAALAAYAVEARSQTPFDDYCEARIFEPLGMTNSGWFLSDFADADAVARPHVITDGAWVVEEHYGFPTWPDGQLRSTPMDLGQVLRLALGDGAVDGERLLPAGAVRALSTEPVAGLDDWYLGDNMEAQYFLWFGMTLGDRWLIGHDGDDIGVTSEMFYDPQTGIGVSLLGNVTDWLTGATTREQTLALQQRLYAIGEEAR